MRHIPEDELHAYLDQALSRSQCVEIECHLAACLRCRHDRDRIASLRDRTTALLGMLAPAQYARPGYAELALAARGRWRTSGAYPAPVTREARRTVWGQRGWRAAGLLVAIAAGWSAREMLPGGAETAQPLLHQLATDDPLEPVAAPQTPLLGSMLPIPGTSSGTATPATSQPDPTWRPDPVERPGQRLADSPRSAVPLTVTVRSAAAPETSSEFGGGVWRTVSWSEAAALTGDAVPRLRGLPVVEVQIQTIGPDQRPLVMVAHLDRSGRIVRTIEGPVELVADLVGVEIERSRGTVRSSSPVRSAPDYYGGSDAAAPSRSIRVVTVAGRLESDALETLVKTVTLR